MEHGDPDGHQNDLVSFEGNVVTAVREEAQDEFVLVADHKLFTAIYRHPPDRQVFSHRCKILRKEPRFA